MTPLTLRAIGTILMTTAITGCGSNDNAPTPSAPASRRAFTPSLEGKKLLHYRGPDLKPETIDQVEQVPFDGLILGGLRPFYQNEKPYDFDAFVAAMNALPFKRYSDNFFLCYAGVDAIDKPDFDWFHDFDWVVENWRTIARTARRAGFKGICFDNEHYGGKPLFGYHEQKYSDTKSFEEYQAQVRRRGAEIMRAVSEEYPDITIIILFGFSGSFYGVPQHPLANAQAYTLVSAFVDGLLSECREGATIHDMHEQGFALRTAGSHARIRRLMTDVVAPHSAYPELYDKHHRAGFSFWADSWGDTGKGRAFDAVDFENNYYTPDEMAYALQLALAYSDKYVWMWSGAFNWWDGTVEVADPDGEPGAGKRVPIPQPYMDALAAARRPDLPPPSLDRKPNSYRVDNASTWAHWADEEAFKDLWGRYRELGDLPLHWRFALDPDEVGVAEGRHRADYDDSAWATIAIKEFWEAQGYTPYDGQAWYRVATVAPAVAAGERLHLAFGAIADEATVYVNGRQVFASEVGDNIRHRLLVVDVSDAVAPGAPAQVAVRVWNTSWCGGIWKNVKWVAGHVR